MFSMLRPTYSQYLLHGKPKLGCDRPRRQFVGSKALPSTNTLFCRLKSVTSVYMADMNIRNIGDALLRRLKSEAALAGKSLREYVIERLEADGGVQGVREAKAVRAPGGRKPAAVGAVDGANLSAAPRSEVCANCDHRKSKHGGFGGACQEDNCLCSGFK
jgi:plasmid stability protein